MSEQTTFESALVIDRPLPGANSQNGKILGELQVANGGWVSVLDLMEASGSINIHTRINDLRRVYGFKIENETDASVKPHVSKYRLVI